MTEIAHALSLDIEDYSNAVLLLAVNRIVPPTPDVVTLTLRMLDLFEEQHCYSTCFVLGEVAEEYPELVREIVRRGHRIGVHGWHHHRLYQLTPREFLSSIVRAKQVMEDLSGEPVLGYRAVAMSLTRDTWWAYEAVIEAGYTYSSSIFPFRGRNFGMPGAPIGLHRVNVNPHSSIIEIPLSVIQYGPFRLPALGGGYLRLFPFIYNRFALTQLSQETRPAVVYLHPYELDDRASMKNFPIILTDEERKKIARLSRKWFLNRGSMVGKVRQLLSSGRFAPIEDVFQEQIREQRLKVKG